MTNTPTPNGMTITIFMQVIENDLNSVIAVNTVNTLTEATQAVDNLKAQGFRAWAWVSMQGGAQ
jgi:hypothetical protein